MIYCNHLKDFRNIRKNSGRVWPFIGWWLFMISRSILLGYPNLDPLAHMLSWLQAIGFRYFLLWKDAKSNIKGISINICHFCSLRVQEEYHPNSLECHVWMFEFLPFWGVEVVVKQYLGNFLLSMILTCTSFPRRSCDFSDDYSIWLRFLEYCSTQDSWAENALFCRSVAVDFGPLMSVAAMVVHVFFAEQCALRMCQTHLHPHRHQMPLPGCVAWFS